MKFLQFAISVLLDGQVFVMKRDQQTKNKKDTEERF